MGVVYIVRTTVQADHETEWSRWQEEEHIGNLRALPGYRGVQRFADTERPHTYLNLWRLESPGAQATEGYRTASLTPWFDRIRPFYDVAVDFHAEPDDVDLSAAAPWRDDVGALVVDRWDPDGGIGPDDAERLLAGAPDDGAVRVVRLARLVVDGAPAPRSAPSTAVLRYLRSVEAAGSLVPAAPGLDRRVYRPLSGYLIGAAGS